MIRVTRFDAAGVTFIAAGGVAVGAFLAGLDTIAGISAGVALAAFITLMCAPEPQDNGDIEALMRATREDMPDRVPDDWVKEFGL